ncbi:MAG: FAD/NAD(P)-binding protein, partial [Candidatus Puniceispirillales bacterium]
MITGKAVDIRPYQSDHQPSWDIRLDNGDMISSRYVVLATGNPSPSAQHLIADDMPADLKAKHIIAAPWKGDAIDDIPSTAHIGLIGGGLTALDACLGLYANNHKGRISLITPHATLPPSQSAWEHMDIPPFPDELTASAFLRHMRSYLPDTDWTQSDWQSACEGIRTQLPDGWRRLPDHDRRRLMNRLGWLWSLIRYRASPQSITAVNAMQSSGQMQIIKDRVNRIISVHAAPPLSLTLNRHHMLDCDYAIIASGVGRDTLMARLMETHIAGTTANGGIHVNDDFQLLSPDCHPQPGLWALGPPTQS